MTEISAPDPAGGLVVAMVLGLPFLAIFALGIVTLRRRREERRRR